MNTPLVSIVIVSYNVRDLLENCLRSVNAASEGIESEVFVVDNNSTDDTVTIVRERFPLVRTIALDENLGFAKANNLALSQSSGRYLLLLNPDTLVQEDTIKTMLQFFSANPEAGMAGCKIITPEGRLEPACRRSFPSPWVAFTKLVGLSTLFPNSSFFSKYNLSYLDENRTYEVDAISGSFMMIRRSVYDQIGGLDEDYFMYGEDLDWCYRVRKHNWKVFYVHQTKIIHYGGESTRRSGIDANAEFYRAMELFSRKNLQLTTWKRWIIWLGIKLRQSVSRSKGLAATIAPVLIDSLITTLTLFLVEIVRFGDVFSLPSYAYPSIYISFTTIMVLSLSSTGAYTQRNYAISRTAAGVMLGFLVLSSLTFFFKDFAFSRVIVLVASALCFILLPLRRILQEVLLPHHRHDSIIGRPTLFVGVSESDLAVLDHIRTNASNNYHVAGLIDTEGKHLGESRMSIPIVGSRENITKVIDRMRFSHVIFAPDSLPYTEILSIISNTPSPAVRYHIAPKPTDQLLTSFNVDRASAIPMIEVEYNLKRFSHRFLKRMLDLLVSGIGLLTLYPFVYFLAERNRTSSCSFTSMIYQLPNVFLGSMSVVGYPIDWLKRPDNVYLGKPGIFGLVQLRQHFMSDEEILTIVQNYARNHSLYLDIEIIVRAIITCIQRKNP